MCHIGFTFFFTKSPKRTYIPPCVCVYVFVFGSVVEASSVDFSEIESTYKTFGQSRRERTAGMKERSIWINGTWNEGCTYGARKTQQKKHERIRTVLTNGSTVRAEVRCTSSKLRRKNPCRRLFFFVCLPGRRSKVGQQKGGTQSGWFDCVRSSKRLTRLSWVAAIGRYGLLRRNFLLL